MQQLLSRYYQIRYNFFSWRYNTGIVNKILLLLGMACITGLFAQIRFYLPWSPVPISGQTFAILMSGIILGAYWGGISQIIYVLIGIAGVPWFAVGTSGINVLFGPTGGYIIGFILASFFLGHFVDKHIKARNFLPMLILMLIANFILIYVPGLLQLRLWLKTVKGAAPSIQALLLMGLVPFIIGDVLKIILASGIAKAITPKKTY
ncbi:MAG: biotin transporter BioY [Spirochaetes bacterium]|nr:biotin transporter BioY [Spirochaetota bacterium]